MTAFSLTVILLNEPLVISDAVLYKKKAPNRKFGSEHDFYKLQTVLRI